MATKGKKDEKKDEGTKDLPMAGINFEADAGKGLETADRDSYAIPFLVALQPLSPAVLEGNPKGAAAGVMINSVTKDLYGAEALIIPCAYQRRWVRWAPRDAGGGFRGEFSTAEVAEMRTKGMVKDLDGRLYFPADDGSINEKKSDRLSDTRSHFVLLCKKASDTVGLPMVLALASTGVKVSKMFNSRIESAKFSRADGSQYTPPSFANLYAVKTSAQKNSKGSWWTFEIAPHGPVQSKALYDQARAFHDSVMKGSIEVAHASMNDGAGEEGGTAKDDGGKF